MTTVADLEPAVQDTHWQSTGFSVDGFVRTNLAALHESVGMTNAAWLAEYMEQIGLSYNAIVDLVNAGARILYTVPRDQLAFHIPQGVNPYANGVCLTTPTRGYTRAQWLGSQWDKTKAGLWYWGVVADAEDLDIMLCSLQNIRDAVYDNCHDCGGCTTHRMCDDATNDPTPHTDPRNFPVDKISLAQEAFGYSNVEDRGDKDPNNQPPPEDNAHSDTYVVEPGDTLAEIAEKFGTSVDQLLRLNPKIKDADLIYVGQVILLPDEDKKDNPKPVTLGPKFAEYLAAHPDVAELYGKPVSPVMPLPADKGFFQRFEKWQERPAWAHLYYTPEYGVCAVYGAIMAAYGDTTDESGEHGWERGPLGVPVSSERKAPPETGMDRMTLFENGYILWASGEGTRVHVR